MASPDGAGAYEHRGVGRLEGRAGVVAEILRVKPRQLVQFVVIAVEGEVP